MSARVRRPFRPQLETLEDRCVPATFTVTSLSDVADPNDGALTLREAVAKANDLVSHPGLDTIAFKLGLEGTIKLTGGEILISDSLTLLGPGASKVTVDGNASSRIFTVSGPGTLNVLIQGLELRNGNAGGQAAGVVVSRLQMLSVLSILQYPGGRDVPLLSGTGPLRRRFPRPPLALLDTLPGDPGGQRTQPLGEVHETQRR